MRNYKCYCTNLVGDKTCLISLLLINWASTSIQHKFISVKVGAARKYQMTPAWQRKPNVSAHLWRGAAQTHLLLHHYSASYSVMIQLCIIDLLPEPNITLPKIERSSYFRTSCWTSNNDPKVTGHTSTFFVVPPKKYACHNIRYKLQNMWTLALNGNTPANNHKQFPTSKFS
jgi:hypothetical protein